MKKFVENRKTAFIVMLFCMQSSLAHSKDDSVKQKDSSNIQIGTKSVKPLPRHVYMPEITYGRIPDSKGEFTLNFSDYNYWIIALISSWNQRSADIAKILNKNIQEFKKRGIGILVLFSQDTDEEVEKWRLTNKPLFDNYFASRNYVDSLDNPQIPVLWLIGRKGEILAVGKMPTLQQIDAIIKNSFILTDF